MSIIYEALERDGIRTRIHPLLRLQRMRNADTGLHSDQLAEIVGPLAHRLSILPEETRWIEIAARLHDLGTIAIPDLILNKRTTLTPAERDIMQSHTQSGYDVLRDVRQFTQVASIVLHHHERYDGTGYPHGLSGKSIPLGSRVIAVLDAFDGMTSERPHRRPKTQREACEEILIGKGTQFDAEIVDAFLEMLRFGVN